MNNEYKEKITALALEIKKKLKQAKEMQNKNQDIKRIMQEVWNLSKEKFKLEAAANQEMKRYEGIIFTVGFSAEPIILTILANEPEYVYFIYTKESEKILDTIMDETNLKPSCYKRGLMPRDSAADSYRLVKKGLTFLMEEKAIKKHKIGLDPTGGTKIMSVGCGIAASIFNLDILYVNNKQYDPELRRPEPGSENLINIPNPFDIYQDDKLIEGINYLTNLNFSIALNMFYKIKLSSSNPLLPELLANIANLLYFWNVIDYSNALNFVDKTKNTMLQLGGRISQIIDELDRILESWEKYLKTINNQIKEGENEIEKISPLLIFDIKTNADREFLNSNFNNAALKYYRTIEMINQYILLNKYQFNTQNPDYEKIADNCKQYLISLASSKEATIESTILKKYNEFWKYTYEKIFPDKEFKEKKILLHKFGLLAGTIIRKIFGDKSINKGFVLDLFQAIEKRNKSIFAHGIDSISKKNCQKLNEIAEKMIAQIKIENEQKTKVFNKKILLKLKDLFFRII